MLGASVVATLASVASGGAAAVAGAEAFSALSDDTAGLFALGYWWYGTIRQPLLQQVSSFSTHSPADGRHAPAPFPPYPLLTQSAS